MLKTLFCLLLISLGAWGQAALQLSFHHLTREEGLSNNNVFFMRRDSRGFLWLGTPNGLNRFDGVRCRVYKPTNSNILGVDIKNIVEDSKGNLWVGSNEGLNFYDRQTDKFSVITLPVGKAKLTAFPYHIDHQGLLWVGLSGIRKAGLYTYHPSTQKFTFVTDQVNPMQLSDPITPFHEVTVLYSGSKNNVGINKISLKNNQVTKIESFFDGTKQPAKTNIGEYLIVENDSILWQTGDYNGLTQLNTRTGKIEHFNTYEGKPITYLTYGVRHNNWLLLGSNVGLYVFDLIKKVFIQHLQHSPSQPDGLAANWMERMYLDEDDNLFLSQPGFGVDYTNLNRVQSTHWLTPVQIASLKLTDNHVNSLVRWRSQSWLNLQSGGTIVLDEKGHFINQYPGKYTLLSDTQERLWMISSKGLEILNPLKRQTKKVLLGAYQGMVGGGSFIVEVLPGEYLFSSNGLLKIQEQKGQFSIKPVASIAKEKFVGCHPMYYDTSTQQVFLSVNWWSGVVVLSEKKGNWEIAHKRLDFPFRVHWFAPSDRPDSLWFCTNQGLALASKQTLGYKLFTEKDGLPDNSVTNLIPEVNGNYWLVTNRGISHFDRIKNEHQLFTSREGANSKEYDWYGNFLLPDGRAIFGGNNGVTVIDPKANNTYAIRPKVQITGLYANEKPLTTDKYIGEIAKIELQPHQNSFAIDLAGIEFGFPQKVNIHYQLQKIDNQWVTVLNPATVRYANLPEGTYEFMVKATDEANKISSEVRTLQVVIHAPFWRTTWFRAILAGVLIGLGYLFYKLRITQIRAEIKYREEIKRVKAEAEIMALRSQMNPHFIFNCMNTIDSYMILNRTSQASDFLQKFSKLIRMILENSRQEFIMIDQDLEALELYIQLEQERSNGKFVYEISIDPKLDSYQYFIPPTLFQPLVENAILHGLRHKKDETGQLYINLKIADNQLIGSIIDNGIGRMASAKINTFKKNRYYSLGAMLTEERIQKLNSIYPDKAYLKIKDIAREHGIGTIAELGLPLLTIQNLPQHDNGSTD
jgi:ligand-binding sensor domain-containing protein